MQVCHFQHLLRQFDKNEPGRFLGEGVSFRAKLIGVLEVPEARGDRMCQEALADLKMAIRAAGEHKQRIQVHVAIDGLRLRDDKTGDSLYHHPVHKISFIAQDMTDSRAFGYIFGSPDTGHRFFGIKTDKAASQVVIAMRDLFQVVFELKKKEIELAKQQLESKTVTGSLARHTSSITETKSKSLTSVGEINSSMSKGAEESGVAELVDLEQELSSLRRGLTQVEGLTPSTDPFGDSFVPSQKGLLPPPPPSGSSCRGRNTPATSTRTIFSPNKSASSLPFDLNTPAADFETPPLSQSTAPPPHSLVENSTEIPVSRPGHTSAPLSFDVFTELDPLGTGRSKPYVDKKLFFQELKNPPKKVLKDLVPTTQTHLSDIVPVTSESKKDQYGTTTTMTSLTRHSGGSVAIAKKAQSSGTMYSGNFFTSDPFAETDPFDSTDPFSETFKEDPFKSMQDFPKQNLLRTEDFKTKKKDNSSVRQEANLESEKNMFNGPLQVTLPPEPTPKSPRLQRQLTDTTKIRQRPQPSSKLAMENVSPPPPLPPKKTGELPLVKPPPRPPHDHEEPLDVGPPLPRPMRKKEPMADRTTKPRLSSVTTNSSEDEYLTPAPPPLPVARRFDITLSQLLTCSMDELAERLRVPATTLSSMTLPQLTDYLRSYLAADNDRAHIHVEPQERNEKNKHTPPATIASVTTVSKQSYSSKSLYTSKGLKSQFEDNFAPSTETGDSFVADFDDFDKKANPSYDRYAAFREIQEEELKAKSILDPLNNDSNKLENKIDSDVTELTAIEESKSKQENNKVISKSPMKSLDELTLDSLNIFKNSVSPKPSQIDAKIEDIKCVMKNLQIEQSRRSVSPRENHVQENKALEKDDSDKYAALREITITEPQDEFESLPPEIPKERKKSDEKSDGFDNSDFFDCIDNSSLSFTHIDDAFRKSPSVKEKDDEKQVEVKENTEVSPGRDLQPPARLSTGSVSDVVSGSSPDAKEKSVIGLSASHAGRWSVLATTHSPCSSDSEPRVYTRCKRSPHAPDRVQTSSSSREISPWDEEPQPMTRLPKPPLHRDRESRHNSSGSREYIDSGSGREKEKMRDKRDARERDRSRDSRESGSTRERDRKDSGSGRDRRDLSKDRDHRDHRERRDRRSRDRENDNWERDRIYGRERDYRLSRSRERQKDYRDRHWKPRHSYDEDEDYSDCCGSERSSPREHWSEYRERWRRGERNYGSLGWRETRRRNEMWQSEDPTDRRYGTTLAWPGRRTGPSLSRRDTERDTRGETREVHEPREPRETRGDTREARGEKREPRGEKREPRDPRRRPRRDETRRQCDYRFSNDFSPRDRDQESPFEDYQETPTPGGKKRGPYSSLEGTRFAFEADETTASPASVSSTRVRDVDSPTPASTRFRFDSDSVSPRSMFEDDFTATPTPRCRTASIAEEEEEGDVPPLRSKVQILTQHRDIKKSESVNIFTRVVDPFENDDFFACTGSDRAARRDNWPGDFQGFDNA